MLKKVSKFFVLAFVSGSIWLIIYGYIRKNDIENSDDISVGKYVFYDSWGKGECNYFIYYINGKKYKENGGRAPVGFSKNIGKFYKIKYSDKHKKSIRALFNQEVTDTMSILKAGFTKEELNKKE